MIQVKHPIIFLDVDGVLNSTKYIKYLHARGMDTESPLDPLCVDSLQALVDKTDAQVVVTSTWRLYGDDMMALMTFFRDYCIPVIGMTESSKNGRREDEIRTWLQKHYVIHDCFIILDDDSHDLHKYDEHLVKTDGRIGMTDADRDRGIELINQFKPSLLAVSNVGSLRWYEMFARKIRDV